jgi:hypothetical protein
LNSKEKKKMEFEWRTVQFFIGEEGVSEVEVDTDDTRIARCTCKVFTSTKRCKHSSWVLEKISSNNGNFAVQVPDYVPDELAFDVMDDVEAWRDFVIKYGKIEVI